MSLSSVHQYIDRDTSEVKTEVLYNDRMLNLIYAKARENPHILFRALSSARISSILAFFNYDSLLGSHMTGAQRFLSTLGANLSECLDTPDSFENAREIFERKIRYWEVRPVPHDESAILSPSDSKVLVGSLNERAHLFIKGKFFDLEELLGKEKKPWNKWFIEGDCAIFRLTPEKYHYNHTPVAGTVLDIYEIPGSYYPCNPGVVITIATPYSKNKRVVTIIDKDVKGGTKAGLVAMVEVVALMIGDIVQCYSKERYDAPVPVRKGLFVERGRPKSLYKPGSSTNVLIFQKDRISFSGDIVSNMRRKGVSSRFSDGFGISLVETDIKVRSEIGRARQ